MSYTISLNDNQTNILITKYSKFETLPTNNYTLFRAKLKDATITIFKTNTLLIQGTGENTAYLDICNILNITPELKVKEKEKKLVNLSIIGTDEVGTGDFFGPIVVAGCFVEKSKILEIMDLGVRDSKVLSDEKIRKIAPKLEKLVEAQIIVLDNLKYNYLVTSRNYNLNKIKALMHNDVLLRITYSVMNFDAVIVDAFTTKKKYFEYLENQKHVYRDVELVEKAESKHLAVACASILARYKFLLEFDKLSEEAGFELPKGAGNKVDLAIKKLINEQNEAIFSKIAKTNFKNLEKVKTI